MARQYDEHCSEIEAFRQKQAWAPHVSYVGCGVLINSHLHQGRASDDKHADRAAKQAEQQRTDMMNSKK